MIMDQKCCDPRAVGQGPSQSIATRLDELSMGLEETRSHLNQVLDKLEGAKNEKEGVLSDQKEGILGQLDRIEATTKKCFSLASTINSIL